LKKTNISFLFSIFASMITTISKNRVLWIDMAKGYGILFVIIGHLGIPYITEFIYAFHMPLFFFLSGIVFSVKNSFTTFLKAKVQHIIVPYFCLGVPVILAKLYYQAKLDVYGIASGMKQLLIQERYTTLWFVSCLLILNYLMYLLVKFIRNLWLKDAIVVSFCLCGILLWRSGITVLPWNIDIAFIVFPFFYMGYRFKRSLLNTSLTENGDGSLPRSTYMMLVVLLTGSVVWFVNAYNIELTGERVDLYYDNLNYEVLTFFTAFLGILMMVFLSQCHVCRPILYIGENSLLFFAWHVDVVFPALWRLYWFLGITPSSCLGVITIKCLSVVLTLIIITVLNEMIRHTKMKFMLGK